MTKTITLTMKMAVIAVLGKWLGPGRSGQTGTFSPVTKFLQFRRWMFIFLALGGLNIVNCPQNKQGLQKTACFQTYLDKISEQKILNPAGPGWVLAGPKKYPPVAQLSLLELELFLETLQWMHYLLFYFSFFGYYYLLLLFSRLLLFFSYNEVLKMTAKGSLSEEKSPTYMHRFAVVSGLSAAILIVLSVINAPINRIYVTNLPEMYCAMQQKIAKGTK